MKILLDTNFIISCINQKIDFFSKANQLIDEKIEFIVPQEVIEELKTISTRKGEKIKDKQSAQVALETIKLIQPIIINLNSKDTDTGIANYSNKNNVSVATLDNGLKSRLKTKILTIQDKTSLGFV